MVYTERLPLEFPDAFLKTAFSPLQDVSLMDFLVQEQAGVFLIYRQQRQQKVVLRPHCQRDNKMTIF